MYPLQPRALFPASAMPFKQSRSCGLLSRATEPYLQKNINNKKICNIDLNVIRSTHTFFLGLINHMTSKEFMKDND